MKNLILILLFFFISINCLYASEYSDFAVKEYSKKYNLEKAHITVKKEHLEIYAQEIGSRFYPFMVYGYGDLKSKNCKKLRITYICLLDCKFQPVWSDISTSE